MQINVLNNSGVAILQAQIVRQTGFDIPQQIPTIASASASSLSTATVFGIANQVILNGQIGAITITDNYSPINTSLFILNDIVYLSNTPGAISTTSGSATSIVGRVTSVGVSGHIFIRSTVPAQSCDVPGPSPPGTQGATGIQGATGLGIGTGSSNTLNMNLQGDLSLIPLFYGGFPFVNVGAELCGGPTTYVDFRARRDFPGTSGVTTIQLELNGVPVPGAILSWLFTDPAFTLKFIPILISPIAGDRLSFRILTIEGGNPENIITEVNG